jgi:hypothetical protein
MQLIVPGSFLGTGIETRCAWRRGEGKQEHPGKGWKKGICAQSSRVQSTGVSAEYPTSTMMMHHRTSRCGITRQWPARRDDVEFGGKVCVEVEAQRRRRLDLDGENRGL